MNAVDRRRDVGMTLTEVIVAVVLTGLITSVLAAAVVAVVRSEDGVARAVGESHDLQQLVNHLPTDVATAPVDPDAYVTAEEPLCGSGPNVLSIDLGGGDAVSYVLDETSGAVHLDRVACDADGETERLNVADLLDRDATPAAAANVTVVGGAVSEVSIRIERVGGSSTVRATPRTTEGLADAYVVGGTCASDEPLTETSGFRTFVEGDAEIGRRAEIEHALAMGGALTFDDGQVATTDANESYGRDPVALYVGSVDWRDSSGTLDVDGSPSGDVVITDQVERVDIDADGWGSQTFVREYRSWGEPWIRVRNGELAAPEPGRSILFASAFTELRSCSEAMAQLPEVCDGCAEHVVPLDIDADRRDRLPYLGSGDVRLDLAPDVTNVLNIGESRLATIGDVTPEYLDATPADVDALVVNVIDDDPSNDVDGRSIVELDDVLRFRTDTSKVIWNFAGIDEVRLPQGLWGTVFAPFSTVVVGDDIEGDLVAAIAVLDDGKINDGDPFEGVIRWS